MKHALLGGHGDAQALHHLRRWWEGQTPEGRQPQQAQVLYWILRANRPTCLAWLLRQDTRENFAGSVSALPALSPWLVHDPLQVALDVMRHTWMGLADWVPGEDWNEPWSAARVARVAPHQRRARRACKQLDLLLGAGWSVTAPDSCGGLSALELWARHVIDVEYLHVLDMTPGWTQAAACYSFEADVAATGQALLARDTLQRNLVLNGTWQDSQLSHLMKEPVWLDRLWTVTWAGDLTCSAPVTKRKRI